MGQAGIAARTHAAKPSGTPRRGFLLNQPFALVHVFEKHDGEKAERQRGKLMKSIFLAMLTMCASRGDAQTLDVILVLDTTPGAEQATDRIRAKAFGDDVRVGVMTAVSPIKVLQELTADKKKVADALQKAGARIGASFGNVAVNQGRQLDLAEALSAACFQLRESEGARRKRAIIVVFARDDSG